MTPRKKTRSAPPDRRRQPSMGSTSVRMPTEFLDWLNDQAAENGSTVGSEIRDAVAAAIVRAGDAERYGIGVVDSTAEGEL